MTAEIDAVRALEVLDSRGDPTVRVTVESAGRAGRFTVPAGASTGSHEASERRDGGDRYGGRGVREAVAAVEGEIAGAVVGRAVDDQAGLDAALRDLDGTNDLRRLGANAVLGVSGAALRTAARVAGRPLYAHVARLAGDDESVNVNDLARTDISVPMPMINVVSGGLHAGGGVPIQDVLVVPVGAPDYPTALEWAWEVRRAVRERIVADGHRPLVADEGGFSPPSVERPADAFELVRDGIAGAGFDPGAGGDLALAVDVAATHFHDPERGAYDLGDGDPLAPEAMVERALEWVERYPIVSVEDPLAESDWAAWARFRERAPDDLQVLGDDLLVTDPERLDRALDRGAANAVLVKPNQAGTVTRALAVCRRALAAGCNPVVSARSGETCDATIADLAVGTGAGQIKVGSLARSERLAKYNRLLAIDDATDAPLARFEAPPGPGSR